MSPAAIGSELVFPVVVPDDSRILFVLVEEADSAYASIKAGPLESALDDTAFAVATEELEDEVLSLTLLTEYGSDFVDGLLAGADSDGFASGSDTTPDSDNPFNAAVSVGFTFRTGLVALLVRVCSFLLLS